MATGDTPVRAAVAALGRLYYPRIVRRGALPPGPLLVVANHPNGLLDGLVLLLALGRPASFLAKSTFFASPPLALVLRAFGAIPVYRPADAGRAGGPGGAAAAENADTFRAARALLRAGGALAMFPEGTPSEGRGLLPLKTGAARIALGAEAESGWSLGLRVVPVGLWFEDQARARTAAAALVGEPIAVAGLRALYEADGRAAARALTEQIRGALELAAARAEAEGRAELARGGRAALGPGRVALLALLAPAALAGAALAAPGLAVGRGLLALLARRHRAGVGTAPLVAQAGGLAAGWGLAALAAGRWLGWGWGLAALAAGPALGYAALRWWEAARGGRPVLH